MPVLASVEAVQLTRICDEDCGAAVTFVGTEGGVVSTTGAGGVVALTDPDTADSFGGVARSKARTV